MDVFERATALGRCRVLSEVPAPALLAIAGRAVAIRLAAGDHLPVRTDAGDAVLVLPDGGLVGELGAFDDDAAVVTEPMTAPTTVIRLWRDDFLDLVAEHPRAARALARDLAARIRQGAR
jgi:CRP-like cAMP-binding protein